MNEGTKQILDGASVTIAVSSLASWLPPAAAFFTIIWSLIRIYENGAAVACKDTEMIGLTLMSPMDFIIFNK